VFEVDQGGLTTEVLVLFVPPKTLMCRGLEFEFGGPVRRMTLEEAGAEAWSVLGAALRLPDMRFRYSCDE